MTAPNDRFWAKVFFRDFIKHYRKMTPEQIVADVEKTMDDLENLEESGTSFGAKMIRASIGRAENYPQASENGKKGGRPRKNPQPEENTEPVPEQPKAQQRTPEKSPAVPAAQAIAPAPAPKAAVKKPGQTIWGTFTNVFLSQEEFNELARLVGNLNATREMVDSLSAKLEDGSITSANHYATLTYWANYRKSHAEGECEEGGRRYETVSEHNMRVSRQADVWIAEHFGKNKKEAVNG